MEGRKELFLASFPLGVSPIHFQEDHRVAEKSKTCIVGQVPKLVLTKRQSGFITRVSCYQRTRGVHDNRRSVTDTEAIP